MKIAVIGAGSTYTPELIYGLLEWQDAPPENIALHDTDKTRLHTNARYCQALAGVMNPDVRITEANLDNALEGADFIITQIRVGGNRQRASDEKFAFDLGWIGQETTGAVGFMKAYRTIPVMTGIVNRAQELCPNAFLINFTNPAGIVSTAIHKATGKDNMIGLCNVPIFMENKIREIIAAYMPDLSPQGKIRMQWGGWNHLSWIFDITLDDKSILDILIDTMTSPEFNAEPYFPVNPDYIRETCTIPSPYLRYFTDTQTVFEEQSKKANRGNEVMEIEARLFSLYQEAATAITEGSFTKENPPVLPEELSKRGGADYSRLAVKLIRDLAGFDNQTDSNIQDANTHILNVPDMGCVFSNDPSKFCEIPVTIENTGDCFFTPVYPRVKFPEKIRNLIDRIGQYEKLTVEAAIEQSIDKAGEALRANPLVSGEEKIESFLSYAMKI
ncbi:MAG: hypothetical protein LWY06_13140 [Firmicutes bacterium]|nr:hypothetical protein [Bacillota bacterium]